jgi:hypothetical protein
LTNQWENILCKKQMSQALVILEWVGFLAAAAYVTLEIIALSYGIPLVDLFKKPKVSKPSGGGGGYKPGACYSNWECLGPPHQCCIADDPSKGTSGTCKPMEGKCPGETFGLGGCGWLSLLLVFSVGVLLSPQVKNLIRV